MKISTGLLLVSAAAVLAGCERTGSARGDVNSIIIAADSGLWAAIGDSVMRALEPPVFAVRNERTFNVTHVAPNDSIWPEMRGLRQVLVIGAADDAWVSPVLDRANQPDASGIVRTSDVWARNQFATALVLPATGDAAAALPQVGRLAAFMDSTFRQYAIQRMYTSAPDSALRDSLLEHRGYGILLPNVYQALDRGESLSMFQTSTQVGGDLVRNILIASREGVSEPSAEAAVAWRDSLAAEQYNPAQITERARVDSTPVPGGVEIQGVWTGTDPSWPLAGPFIARMVVCPQQNRTYLVDTWLFAPSRKKYEYVIQLQTILSTFECGAGS
ncbi:MAG TPA: DUF4837 family protein [Longimicrobiales bacterium]|nr:DUF4837 family protein [Longimicrobiales bacterium]